LFELEGESKYRTLYNKKSFSIIKAPSEDGYSQGDRIRMLSNVKYSGGEFFDK